MVAAAFTETPAQKRARLLAKLETLTEPGDKRVRKRIFAAIGKLNKELGADAVAGSAPTLSAPPLPSAPADGAAGPVAKRPRRAELAAGAPPSAPAPEPTPPAAGAGRVRVDRRRLNREIAALAKRKQLAGAEQLFARARAQGAADVHTHTNMINAAVRCGQLGRAEELLRGMAAGEGPAPNVVAFTVLLKGYAAAGRMADAEALLAQMCEARAADGSSAARPNLRTANTLLRGCVRAGDAALAERTVARMRAEWGVSPDASSYEALALALCQGLRVRRVRALLASLRDQPALAHAPDDEGAPAVHPRRNGAIWLALARAHALLRQWAEAAEALGEARGALEAGADVHALVRQRGGGGQPRAPAGAAEDGGGGAQTADTAGGGVHLSAKSVGAFLAHRRSELLLELGSLEQQVEREREREAQPQRGEAEEEEAEEEGEESAVDERPAGSERNGPTLADAYARLLVLAPEHAGGAGGGPARAGTGAGADARALCAGSVRRAEAAFGLGAYAKHTARLPGGRPAAATLAAVRERLRHACAGGGAGAGGARLRLSRLFDARDAGRGEGARPAAGAGRARLHVEVCCGSGEWAVEQAQHDARTAWLRGAGAARAPPSAEVNWVALELRADRAFQAFARVALARVRNCAVLCGDAAVVFDAQLEPASVDCVCVNHPQPPEWSGGTADSNGDHLLTPAFLASCHAALRPGGTLTIVTDNLRYGRSLAASLSAAAFAAPPRLFEPALPPPAPSAPPAAAAGGDGAPRLAPGEQGRVPLLEGTPPASCGYTVRASSYFDRLWANGNRRRRFFVAVRRAAEDLD